MTGWLLAGNLAQACLVGVALLATGLASAPRASAEPQTAPPETTTPGPAPDASAQIYIVRPEVFAASLRAASIELDGVQLGALGNGGCLATRSTPGDHLIVQSWPYWLGDSHGLRQKFTVRGHWEAGRTYYYALMVRDSQTNAGIVRETTFEWRVAPIDPDAGASFVADHKCKTVGGAPHPT